MRNPVEWFLANAGVSRRVLTISGPLEEEIARMAFGVSHDTYVALPGDPQWAKPGGLSKADILTVYKRQQQIGAALEQMKVEMLRNK